MHDFFEGVVCKYDFANSIYIYIYYIIHIYIYCKFNIYIFSKVFYNKTTK